MTLHVRRVAAAIAALVMLPAWAMAQQSGSITGRVVDAATQQPIVSVQIRVVGTTLGTLTGDDGRYRINGVTPGTARVTAQRIGYAARTDTVAVPDGGVATADFALAASAVQLEGQIITASGDTRRTRETGASVANINVADVPKASINSFSDVLSSRTAGVTVESSGGTAGTGSRIRIRGSNSISLSNDPIIIIDGVRLNNDANSTTIGVGGQQPSRFDDLNPEDIESMEVIKGPAAAALYGTAASNGVIQITTKRGRAGATRWNAFAEYGSEKNYVDFPANYAMFGTRTDNGKLTRNCNIISQAAGSCTADSLVSFNPLVAHSPFINGWRQNYGLSAAGGGEKTTYYVAGTYNREQGVYDPNKLRRINMRANLHSQLSDKVDVTVTTNYLQSRVAFPQNDNNSEGVVSGGLLGKAFDTPNEGYFFVSPSKLFQLDTRQNVDRFTGGLTGNYQPLSWLKAVLQTGVDYTTRYDQFFVKPGIFTADEDPDAAVGERASNPYQIWDYTANGSLTGSFQLRPQVTSRTTLGVQYEREYLHGTRAFGENLTPGTSSLAGANALFSVDEESSDIITLGAYAQEELGWRDRLFVTGALRTDKNSAFGVDYGYVYYPAVNLSWVLGEEPFFPKTDVLSSLRLRAAYGESGQHPRFRDAITFYSPAAVITQGQEVAGITIGGTGDPNLRPEKSGEYEFGFDAGFFKDRGSLSFTYYNKTTRDALVAQRLAPSLGVSNTRFVNLGKVRNSGVELLLNATVVQTEPVSFDITFNGSTTNNKLIDLGKGIEPIIFGLGGDTQRHQNGYPLGGYWQKPILSYADANGDGIIAPSEVQVGDTAVYMGSPYPRRELAITPRVTLFKYVTVSSLFDYRGGFKLYNGTEDFRCGTIRNCRAIQDKNTPLADQAAAVADAQFNTVAGYIEDATFWKLRELSVTLNAPSTWASRAGVHGVSLTLAGRNLATWTKYRGLDPELNEAAQANFTQADFLTQPPVRYYTARVNVTW